MVLLTDTRTSVSVQIFLTVICMVLHRSDPESQHKRSIVQSMSDH